MAFPDDPLGTEVQLKINNEWVSVVRYDDDTKILQSRGVEIERGQGGLDDRTPTGSCKWEWFDPNGVYNNENPRSEYYGLIPRNTPVRVYVPREETSLFIVDVNDGARAQTADKAALDIIGDIEIRMDFEPRRFTRWSSGENRAYILCSKFGASGQRSWYVRFGDPATNNSVSALSLNWSANGTAVLTANCTGSLPTTGRISIKITMDVNNGAGSREVKFFTSTTGINGTYTQLGSTVTGATTSIFSSTANVELASWVGGSLDATVTSNTENYHGRIYAFQLWNGISGSGGSMVAEADFTGEVTGTTSFSDGLGNTWDLFGVAEITNADYQFHGELSAPKQQIKRTVDGIGTEITMAAEAGGIIRRLISNNAAAQSAIYLQFSTYNANGWWTGEDATAADTTIASSGVSDVAPATISDITFAGFDAEIPGSAGVMLCGGTAPSFVGICKGVTATTELHFYGYFCFPSVPVADQIIFSWYTNGTVKRFDLTVGTLSYHQRGYGIDGTLLIDNNVSFGSGGEPDRWIAYHSRVIQNGGNVDVSHEWHAVGTDLYFTGSPDSTAGTVGKGDRIVLQGGSGLADVKFCQVMLSSKTGLEFFSGTPTANTVNFSRGFAGELADARVRRIGALLGVQVVIIGELDNSEALGPQPIDTPMNIIYECPVVDGGVLTEAADQLAIEYRTRKSLNNQFGLVLAWSDLAEGLEGTPDDTDVANDIIMQRRDGGSARATLEFGPMSIQAPPDGINTVPDGPIVNNYLDSRIPALVQYRLLRFTWPTSRYPAANIDLHHPTFTGDAALRLLTQKTEITDMLTITDLPNAMAPDDLILLIKGVKQELKSLTRMISWDLIPYGPYQVAELTGLSNAYTYKAAHTTIEGVVQQQLNAGITSSATSLAAKTLSGVLFSTTATNIPIKIRGELMTVTAVSGSTSPQTLTVTRGVNGYQAAHDANDPIIVYPTLKASL